MAHVLNQIIEYPIDAENTVTLKVTTPECRDFCDGCFFEDRTDCPTLKQTAGMECSRGTRQDGEDVIFKLII